MKIAVTGGIGSGKSTVCKIIEEHGYRVFSCDEIYKTLLTEESFINAISNEFGKILTEDGQLDRKKLSAIVFHDKEKLNKLNELTHSAIIDRALTHMSGKGVQFCEVPLLFEEGYESYFDNVIVVIRDTDKRISSVMERDMLSVEEVKNRINCQFDYKNIDFKEYYVIHNNGDMAYLNKAVSKTLQLIESNN